MGIAAALIYPAMPAHLTAVFTDRHEKATAVGIWSGICGLAVALDPAAGGVLLRHYSWSSIFVVNIPLAVLALAGLSLVSETQDPYRCGITAIYFAHCI